MPPYNHPKQVSCLLPNQEMDRTKHYLLQAPQPPSTNRSMARKIPTSFPGTKDVRDSSYLRPSSQGHCPNIPFCHRPTAPQHRLGFSSSLTPPPAPFCESKDMLPSFSALKTAVLDSLSNSVAIPCSSPPSFSGGFTQSPCFHLLLTSQFTAVWFSLLKQLFLRQGYKSFLDGKAIPIFLKISTVWHTSPPVLWISPNHCFCLTCQPLPPHQPPDKLGAPSPFHATHFLRENVNDYRLMNLNIHLQLILIRPLSWDADPSTQRPMSIFTWRPTATSNQQRHQILHLPSSIFQLI